MKIGFTLMLILGVIYQPSLWAESPVDGPHIVFKDAWLDNIIGTWVADTAVMGKQTRHSIKARWVLNHQFIQLHITDVLNPKDYEAFVFIGYDNLSERYVCHWIDSFGGRASETIGYGQRTDETLQFIFEYPDGPFHTSFRWNPTLKTWYLLGKTKNKTGTWMTFTEQTWKKQ